MTTMPVPTIAPDMLRVRTGYFDVAFDDTQALIDNAARSLARVDFDTFVATGLSGTCVATLLGHALDKKVLIVRKEDDQSTHSSKRYAGNLGKRWVFLDDFVSSGATRRRVKAMVQALVERQSDHGYYDTSGWRWVEPNGFTTEYVGDYTYAWGGTFSTPDPYAEED